MSEADNLKEGSREEGFSLAEHQEFVNIRTNHLQHKARKILGSAFIGGGAVFALTGIADFITGNRVSEILMNTNPENTNHIITWASHHLSEMPLLLKTGGGASMITAGKILADKTPN